MSFEYPRVQFWGWIFIRIGVRGRFGFYVRVSVFGAQTPTWPEPDLLPSVCSDTENSRSMARLYEVNWRFCVLYRTGHQFKTQVEFCMMRVSHRFKNTGWCDGVTGSETALWYGRRCARLPPRIKIHLPYRVYGRTVGCIVNLLLIQSSYELAASNADHGFFSYSKSRVGKDRS